MHWPRSRTDGHERRRSAALLAWISDPLGLSLGSLSEVLRTLRAELGYGENATSGLDLRANAYFFSSANKQAKGWRLGCTFGLQPVNAITRSLNAMCQPRIFTYALNKAAQQVITPGPTRHKRVTAPSENIHGFKPRHLQATPYELNVCASPQFQRKPSVQNFRPYCNITKALHCSKSIM